MFDVRLVTISFNYFVLIVRVIRDRSGVVVPATAAEVLLLVVVLLVVASM